MYLTLLLDYFTPSKGVIAEVQKQNAKQFVFIKRLLFPI